MESFESTSKATNDGNPMTTRRQNPLFAVGSDARDENPPAPPSNVDCVGCPISMVVDTLVAAQPEAMDHLLAAASETLAALQVVLDAAQNTIELHRAALQTNVTPATPETDKAQEPSVPSTPSEAPRSSAPKPRTPRKRPPRVQRIDLS